MSRLSLQLLTETSIQGNARESVNLKQLSLARQWDCETRPRV